LRAARKVVTVPRPEEAGIAHLLPGRWTVTHNAREQRDRKIAVDFLWHHLSKRQRSAHDPVDVLDDGTLTTFLTVGYVSRSLRAMGVRPSGEKFARRVIALLIESGHLVDTGRVKKPRVPEQTARRRRFATDSASEGGQDAQTDIQRSRWFRVFALPRLGKPVVSRFGTWVAGTSETGRRNEASRSALLRCQELEPAWQPLKKFSPGSVQEAFHVVGPP